MLTIGGIDGLSLDRDRRVEEVEEWLKAEMRMKGEGIERLKVKLSEKESQSAEIIKNFTEERRMDGLEESKPRPTTITVKGYTF